MPDLIFIGGTADIECKIRNRSGDFVDPGVVSARWRAPDGTSGTVVHGVTAGSQMEKVATGIYVAHLIASVAGRWEVDMVATSPQEITQAVYDVTPL